MNQFDTCFEGRLRRAGWQHPGERSDGNGYIEFEMAWLGYGGEVW